MFVRHSRSRPGFLIAILAIALSLSLPLAGHAQDIDADYEFRMGLTGDPISEIPDRSVAAAVFNEDQTVEFGACTIDLVNKPGGCFITVPASTTVTALLDESTLPEGVVVLENPIVYTTPAEKTGVGDIVFELAYAGNDDESPGEPATPVDPGNVSELPGTGSGPLETASSWAMLSIVTASGAMAVILGVGALLSRLLRTK